MGGSSCSPHTVCRWFHRWWARNEPLSLSRMVAPERWPRIVRAYAGKGQFDAGSKNRRLQDFRRRKKAVERIAQRVGAKIQTSSKEHRRTAPGSAHQRTIRAISANDSQKRVAFRTAAPRGRSTLESAEGWFVAFS